MATVHRLAGTIIFTKGVHSLGRIQAGERTWHGDFSDDLSIVFVTGKKYP